jgi:hypothetical protein
LRSHRVPRFAAGIKTVGELKMRAISAYPDLRTVSEALSVVIEDSPFAHGITAHIGPVLGWQPPRTQ